MVRYFLPAVIGWESLRPTLIKFITVCLIVTNSAFDKMRDCNNKFGYYKSPGLNMNAVIVRWYSYVLIFGLKYLKREIVQLL